MDKDAEAELNVPLSPHSRSRLPELRLIHEEPPMAAGKEIRGKIKSVREHQEDHQGHGNGGGVQDAQGAGPHAGRPPLYATKFATSP
jgi:hypothetical protein